VTGFRIHGEFFIGNKNNTLRMSSASGNLQSVKLLSPVPFHEIGNLTVDLLETDNALPTVLQVPRCSAPFSNFVAAVWSSKSGSSRRI